LGQVLPLCGWSALRKVSSAIFYSFSTDAWGRPENQ
jgi:hypothetical protein